MNDIELAHWWGQIREVFGDKAPTDQQWKTICEHLDNKLTGPHKVFAETMSELYGDRAPGVEVHFVAGEAPHHRPAERRRPPKQEYLPAPQDGPEQAREKLSAVKRLLENLE